MLHSGWGLERGGNENFWHFDKKYFLGKNRIWMGFHSLIWDDLSERVDHPFVNSITISIVLRKLMSVPCAIPNYLMYLVAHGKYFNHIYINRERIEIKLQLRISHNLPIQNNNLSANINCFIPIEFTHAFKPQPSRQTQGSLANMTHGKDLFEQNLKWKLDILCSHIMKVKLVNGLPMVWKNGGCSEH